MPYDGNATLLIRSETDEDITGCWAEGAEAVEDQAVASEAKSETTERDIAGHLNSYHDTSSCVDVSYKTLCDSYDAYEQRTLYTEQEMVSHAHA